MANNGTPRQPAPAAATGGAARETSRDRAVADDASTDATAQLDDLARAYGIESSFVDAHGNERQTPDATKRALLGAMGVRADSADDVRAARDAFEAARWERAVPPVVVATVGAVDVPVVAPAGTRALPFALTREDGSLESGEISLAEWPSIESVDHGGRRLERRNVRLAVDLPCGYHQLRVGDRDVVRLIVSPGACWLPNAVHEGEHMSGIALQLYLVRSAANWGIGDFSDLRAFVDVAARAGADIIGLNPLHELFTDNPEHASPYSPQSRLLLNVLNIDVTAIAEYARSPRVRALVDGEGFAAALAACRAARFVDYTTVATLKLEALRVLFDDFRRAADEPGRARIAEFERYRSALPEQVERMFLFAALREHFARNDRSRAAWQQWPAEYRDPAAPAVARFARDHVREVDFVAWLQWIADGQLAAAAAAAGAMRVGLYRDLAVGADPGGAETWCNARAVIDAARVGAPPDIYIPAGQNWDLPPFDPYALREEGYASFIDLVRANMRHAGGLRIDHVMALQHEYWIPRGADPADGAYVRYPLADLVGIIALESHRARCLVVGEDLGTVPEGFRETMAAANILSYRVLFFERDDTSFTAPADYPRLALAVIGNHDLPTLRAWWDAGDIRVRARLGLADDAATEQRLRDRVAEREAFVTAMRDAQALGEQDPADAEALFTAAHVFLARTASVLAVAQLDDITGESDPVNVPTTSTQYPNWRRRMRLSIEDLAEEPRLATLFDVMRAAGRLRREALLRT